jgi:hypothetical protein
MITAGSNRPEAVVYSRAQCFVTDNILEEHVAFFEELQRPLHLCDLNVGLDDTLEIIVRHAVGKPGISVIGRDGWDIMSYPTRVEPSETFRISFNSYVTFSVRLEHLFPPDDDAEFEGFQFTRFKKSQYLEFVSKTSYGDDIHPGSIYHYGIYCLNQLIDVVSRESPSVAFLGQTAC